MKRSLVLVVAVSVLGATLAACALAALPKNGALYEGSLYADGTAALTKQVRLKVAPTGKSARVTWSCGAGRAPSTLQFKIKPDGTFKAFSNTGALTVWSFVGRFLSPTTARAVLHLNATCDGKGGTLNLNAKP